MPVRCPPLPLPSVAKVVAVKILRKGAIVMAEQERIPDEIAKKIVDMTTRLYTLEEGNRNLKFWLAICIVLIALMLLPFVRYNYRYDSSIHAWFCLDRLTGRVWVLYLGAKSWEEQTQPTQ
jgi:membrane-associated HD superfamily phosphohydrolase